MFDTLMRMWVKGALTEAKVKNAVTKGWISQEQCDQILASPHK